MSSSSPNDNHELVRAVIETLKQGEMMLAEINDEVYSRKVEIAFNASIGGHFRHCLDHFRSLLAAAPSGDLNYDLRERGTLVENDRKAALQAVRKLREDYAQMPPWFLSRPLLVTCKTSYATVHSQASPSTVGREIMYAIAHAVHHYALIAVMGNVTGLQMPPGFGVAPSTLQHNAQTSAFAA